MHFPCLTYGLFQVGVTDNSPKALFVLNLKQRRRVFGEPVFVAARQISPWFLARASSSKSDLCPSQIGSEVVEHYNHAPCYSWSTWHSSTIWSHMVPAKTWHTWLFSTRPSTASPPSNYLFHRCIECDNRLLPWDVTASCHMTSTEASFDNPPLQIQRVFLHVEVSTTIQKLDHFQIPGGMCMYSITTRSGHDPCQCRTSSQSCWVPALWSHQWSSGMWTERCALFIFYSMMWIVRQNLFEGPFLYHWRTERNAKYFQHGPQHAALRRPALVFCVDCSFNNNISASCWDRLQWFGHVSDTTRRESQPLDVSDLFQGLYGASWTPNSSSRISHSVGGAHAQSIFSRLMRQWPQMTVNPSSRMRLSWRFFPTGAIGVTWLSHESNDTFTSIVLHWGVPRNVKLRGPMTQFRLFPIGAQCFCRPLRQHRHQSVPLLRLPCSGFNVVVQRPNAEEFDVVLLPSARATKMLEVEPIQCVDLALQMLTNRQLDLLVSGCHVVRPTWSHVGSCYLEGQGPGGGLDLGWPSLDEVLRQQDLRNVPRSQYIARLIHSRSQMCSCQGRT